MSMFRARVRELVGFAVAVAIVFCLIASAHGPVRAASGNGCSHWQVLASPEATLAFWREATAEQVQRCLAAGADPTAQSLRGSGVLHAAARGGNAEAAKLLIAAGAHVNAQNKDGYTPLHGAVVANLEVVKVLIGAGANVNAEAGSVTLDPIMDRVNPRGGVTPLREAIRHHVRVFKGPRLEDEIAREIAKALIAAGANIDARDSDGMTPLGWAAQLGRQEAGIALIAAGAMLDLEDNWGVSPWFRAVHSREPELVLAMLDAGADACVRDMDGRTAFYYMQDGQRREDEFLSTASPELLASIEYASQLPPEERKYHDFNLRGTEVWQRLQRADQAC